MKLNSKTEVRSEKLGARSFQPSTFNLQPSRRGIALVITLIMLSVTLVMAIAFIAVSRRSRNASATGTDSTTARLAADAALAAAQAQIVANIFVTNAAAYDFKMVVSTNYISPFGFDTVAGGNLTNISFVYPNGTPLLPNDFNTVVGNLFFLPRVPVSIYNRATGSNDFRFYLDLNRNGLFEDSGTVINVDHFGNALTNLAGNAQVAVTGDPQWVGILERPDQPHSADNHFIARYAFFAQPIGNSLDLNAIHNQTLNTGLTPHDGFFRNQGVGSWELNLAAFFADLNTNIWSADNFATAVYYQYNPLGFNSGVAFDDARAMLSYRYNFTYANLASASASLGSVVNSIYPFDNIDNYSDGPLQTTTTNISELLPANRDVPANAWAGANNPNSFYALPADLFDTSKVTPGFISRLTSASTNTFGGTTNSTYDRYTFYRLLQQLSTDSTADDTRMNLNYDNLTPAFNGVANVTGTSSATNLLPWTPLRFFTNAADRMLTFYTTQWLNENATNYTATFGTNTTTAFGVTHIPVYVNGRFVYTPAVNRLLQLAANLYDATTNDVFPSVFRPIFTRTGTNVFITGYTNILTVSGPGDPVFSVPANVEAFAQGGLVNPINIYGVPWIIGAKKNLPAFNKFYSYNLVALTRKLQVSRNDPTVPGALRTNQMFVMSITNRLGASFWNPYNQALTNQSGSGYTVVLHDQVSMILSNGANHGLFPSVNWPDPTPRSFDFQTNLTIWPGSGWGATAQDFSGNSPQTSSFILTNFDANFLPESVFSPSRNQFFPTILNFDPAFEPAGSPVPVFPQFNLMATNSVQAFILDGNRVIDYVHLAGPNGSRNLNDEIADKTSNPADQKRILADTAMWDTNWVGNSTAGVRNQVYVSFPNLLTGVIIAGLPPEFWKKPGNLGALPATPENEAAFFSGFFHPSFQAYPRSTPPVYYQNSEPSNQVPFTPTRYVYDYSYLQANDPLVHYLYGDLINFDHTMGREDDVLQLPQPDVLLNILGNDKVTSRYQPWGRNDQLKSFQSGGGLDYDVSNPFNFSYRDSLVWGSDFWDFPANKYPSVGWIGRVHRGTPWQTVYLKATNLLSFIQIDNMNNIHATGTNTWKVWSANQNNFDAVHAAPVNDSLLFDLFTTAPNDNAQRGTLSVNQTELASLSALLSGLVVLTNDTAGVLGAYPTATTTPIITNLIISPAGVAAFNSALGQIQNAITTTRGNTNLFPLGVFTHVGDILRVPALTENSPFLQFVDNDGAGTDFRPYDISDELYEWLPQQTMGLLRLGTPRYVVYCYGDALKPAQNGTVLGGNFPQLVTNYQVVAESAMRVVLRIDNATGTNGSPRVVVESSRPLAPQ